MSADEYVPDEEELVDGYRRKKVTLNGWTYHPVLSRAEIRRGLARVRRDAAREALDRAEHRIARLEAQTSIRGRAVVYARERTREAEAERDRNLRNSREAKKRAIRAEARIKAVQDVLDRYNADGLNPYALGVDIRRALDLRATDGEAR